MEVYTFTRTHSFGNEGSLCFEVFIARGLEEKEYHSALRLSASSWHAAWSGTLCTSFPVFSHLTWSAPT